MGLSGAVVAVSCQVSSAKCGDYHSIKWYKEGGRVAVYSPATKWWRVEGHLHDRAQVKVDEENANLTFTLSAGDEGQYKCEISFLSISLHCPVVQVTSLVTRAMPESVTMSLLAGSLATQVTGDLIGPYQEGTQLRLRCEVGGG